MTEISEATKMFLRNVIPQMERHSPQATKFIKMVMPKIQRMKTLRSAMNATWKSIPKHLKTKELMGDITRWGEMTKEAVRYKTTGAMPSELTRRAAATAPPVAKGMMSAAAPLIGAGAAATAGMAYPMHRLGQRLGYGIEERRAGRRLRPAAMPFREVARQLPGASAIRGLLQRSLTPQMSSPTLFGKIRSVRFKEAK